MKAIAFVSLGLWALLGLARCGDERAPLAIDAVRIEIGYALLPMINDEQREPRLDDQVRALRRQMATDFGFVLPSVRIIDNMGLKPNEYVITIKETEAARGEIRVDKLLMINPGGGPAGLPGEPTTMQPLWGNTTLIHPLCHFFL